MLVITISSRTSNKASSTKSFIATIIVLRIILTIIVNIRGRIGIQVHTKEVLSEEAEKVVVFLSFFITITFFSGIRYI